MNLAEFQQLFVHAVTMGVFLGFIIGILLAFFARR